MAVATAEGSARLLPRLEAAHEQWVLLYAVLVAAVSNALINTGLGWLSTHNSPHIPRFGVSITHPSLITQGVGTLFFLPLFTTLITTYGVRETIGNGDLQPLTAPAGRWWAWLFPQRPILRGARLGLAALVTLGPILVVLIVLLAPHGCDRHQFLVANSAFGVVFGAIATPIIAMAAMCDDAHTL